MKKCLEDNYADEIEIKILEDIVPLFFGQSSIFLDIGANIGLYSYYILPVLPQNAKCIAFEPRSETYLRLNKNVIDEKNRFKAEKIALSNRIGVADLFLPTSHGRSSLLWQDEFEGFKSEKVPVSTLDNYLEVNQIKDCIDFIKIDVEGHELEVIYGAEKNYTKLPSFNSMRV